MRTCAFLGASISEELLNAKGSIVTKKKKGSKCRIVSYNTRGSTPETKSCKRSRSLDPAARNDTTLTRHTYRFHDRVLLPSVALLFVALQIRSLKRAMTVWRS